MKLQFIKFKFIIYLKCSPIVTASATYLAAAGERESGLY